MKGANCAGSQGKISKPQHGTVSGGIKGIRRENPYWTRARPRQSTSMTCSAGNGSGSQLKTDGRIVICGGGIIGAATAFYLAELGVGPQVTVIEREGVACAASGKAGGFLALDWSDTSGPMRSLTRTSYALHSELADIFGAERIGYRPVRTLSVAGSQSSDSPPSSGFPGSKLLPKWVDGPVLAAASLGTEKTTAQVNPSHLTHALMDSALQRGATLLKGTVSGLEIEQGPGSRKHVTGVKVDNSSSEAVPADVVVLAMGPWTSTAAARMGLTLPKITGQKYHSVVLQLDPEHPASADMLFTNYTYDSGREVEPEIYPRPDGTVYVCGEPQSTPVPEGPEGVSVVEELSGNLLTFATSLSSALKKAQVAIKQACYLPIGPDSSPIIGPVPEHAGVFVATGHTCWGILNAPATGKALAELIVEGKSSCVDLRPFSMERFSVASLSRAR